MSFAADLPAQTAPIIFGCTGPELGADEAAFFRAAKPAGFILFQKNCVDPQQVMRLCADLRDTVGWRAPVLIDQEGGRVQRLKAPNWPDFPKPRSFGDMYATDPVAALTAIADNCTGLAGAQCPIGIDVNCIPCLDVVPKTNTVRAIDDRSYGHDPDVVAALGLAAARASIAAGMTPVMKHIPGHGRAVVDSHFELPRVTDDRAVLERDWRPFRHLSANIDNAALWGMTAHVIYPALDPELPATLSPAIIGEVIRAALGFDGILVTDDLFMEALKPWGDVPERARLAVQAGCDLALHCHGDVAAREKALEVLPPMGQDTCERLADWLKTLT